jgi:hypothetical protein
MDRNWWMRENREYYQYDEENRMSAAVNTGWGARTQHPNGSEATSVPEGTSTPVGWCVNVVKSKT